MLGCEGSGHHGFHALLDNFYNDNNTDFQGNDWYKKLLSVWSIFDPTKKSWKSKYFSKKTDSFKTLINEYAEIERILLDNIANVFIITASFPFNQPRALSRSPDLISFDSYFSHEFKIYYLHIERNTTDCISSALRREFTNDFYEQFKIYTWNDAYIKQFLATTNQHKFSITFESMLASPEEAALKISNFIGEPIKPCIEKLQTPKPNKNNQKIKDLVSRLLSSKE